MDQERFSTLILYKLKNTLTVEEALELKKIIASDEVFANQHRFFLEYWNDKGSDNTHSQRLFEELQLRIQQTENKSIKVNGDISIKRWIFAAASIIVLITGGLFIYKTPVQRSTIQKELSTSLSEKKRIQLKDGSLVILNGNSNLTAQKISAKQREITLVGEAFFDIKEDHKRPFIIHTIKMDIQVLGTSFNVRAYPNEELQQTTLINGKIKVILHDKNKSVIYLKPNDKVTVATHRSPAHAMGKAPEYVVSQLEKYDVNDTTAIVETAWIENHLVFRDLSFETLANQLETRYGTPVIFKSETTKKYRFSGTFKKENLHEVLHILSRTGIAFNYEFKDGKVYIN